ncbi:hypothetical protein LNV09_13105 [Paucibacter sp. B2R-40]|uniref:hypothetical protein n=1 Tax=Paucibacter sp. B2R-40 TaxID=2893554 RepID=UPI0021E3FA0D|nr:hypothetical protein [Paucibacter sp. B2R-40]MCV2355091.1 hypothetical protein [Paucibacter sp. B2R-40]
MMTFEADAARRRRQLALLPLLALLHLAIGLGLASQWRHSKPTPATTARIEMRLLAAPLVPKPKPAAMPMPAATQPPAQPLAMKARAPITAPITAPKPPAIQEGVTPSLATEAMEAAASAPLPTAAVASPGLLINTEATRRALRQASRSPLLSERAATAMGDGPPLERSEILGQEIKKAGTGDCLKGDFLGGGMGLLSAPFWLLAEARGKCAK